MPEKMTDTLEKDYQLVDSLFRNGGKDPEGRQMKMEDALSIPNATVVLPKVISQVVQDEVEPLLTLTPLLQQINIVDGQVITFPALGSDIEAVDMAEGQEYPEVGISMGGGTKMHVTGKVGMAVKFSEEMVQRSQFDLIGMILRKAAFAFAKHKEKKAFNVLLGQGLVAYDNVSQNTSVYGPCTGLNHSGSGNGSMAVDDLFNAMALMMENGFMPNVLLVHPQTWMMFVRDPIMRLFALNNGGGSYFQKWAGQVGTKTPWSNGAAGALGLTSANGVDPINPTITQFSQTQTAAPVLPNYFPFPFRIEVSPFVPYDPRTKLTDILLIDAPNAGALLQSEALMTEKWTDPSVDMHKVKMRERYSVAILEEGNAVISMKNVHVVPNSIALPAQATVSSSGSFTVPSKGDTIDLG